MNEPRELADLLRERSVSRHAFLAYASWMSSLLAPATAMAPAMARGLKARRQAVIWLSFQGVHRLHRVTDAQLQPDAGRAHLRLHLAGLPPRCRPVRARRPSRRSASR